MAQKPCLDAFRYVNKDISQQQQLLVQTSVLQPPLRKADHAMQADLTLTLQIKLWVPLTFNGAVVKPVPAAHHDIQTW